MGSLVIILAVLFSPGLANSSTIPDKWMPVVKSSSGYLMYLDTSNIEKAENGTMRIWVKTAKGKGSYDLSYFGVDCKNSRFALLSILNFSPEGDIVAAEIAREEKWNEIPPGSSMESIKKVVCR